MSDYSSNFRSSEDKNFFLFVIMVQEEESEDAEANWEGKVNAMRHFTKKHFEDFEQKFNKAVLKIQAQIDASTKRDIQQDKDLKAKISKMIYSNA